MLDFFGGLFDFFNDNVAAPPQPNPLPNQLIQLFETDPDQGFSWLRNAYANEPPPWAPWHPEYEFRTTDQIEAATQLAKQGIHVPFGAPIPTPPSTTPPSTTPPSTTPPSTTPVYETPPEVDTDSVNQGLRLLDDPLSSALEEGVAKDARPRVGILPATDGSRLRYPIVSKNGIDTISKVPTSGGSPNSREFGAHVRGGRGHAGIDLPGNVGDPYVAQWDGEVLRAGYTKNGYGHFIDVKFSNGYIKRIAHLGNLDKGGQQKPWPDYVKAGAKIKAGQVLGFVGTSGNAGAEFPHAHVEVFANDQKYRASFLYPSSLRGIKTRVDPRKFFQAVEQSRTAGAKGKPDLRSRSSLGAPKGSQKTFSTSRLTAYSPYTGSSKKRLRMEGGRASSRRGPDGHALVRTIHDYMAGDSPYITIAGNPKFYGNEYVIPKLKVQVNGKTQTLTNVRAVVHDTGAAFRKAPEGRFDIALGHNLSDREMATNAGLWKDVEFIRMK
jgi:murein DD-endopeptidase MepM/ murein hydrolase activator NlpD